MGSSGYTPPVFKLRRYTSAPTPRTFFSFFFFGFESFLADFLVDFFLVDFFLVDFFLVDFLADLVAFFLALPLLACSTRIVNYLLAQQTRTATFARLANGTSSSLLLLLLLLLACGIDLELSTAAHLVQTSFFTGFFRFLVLLLELQAHI